MVLAIENFVCLSCEKAPLEANAKSGQWDPQSSPSFTGKV